MPTVMPTTLRFQTMMQWLGTQAALHGLDLEQVTTASADASFRRYFRVAATNHGSLIVMDAPPEHEDCRPFVQVAALFAQAGVTVPHVLAQDFEQGFLLLTDLGHTTYLSQLHHHSDGAATLYGDAAQALIRIQLASRPDVLPVYDRVLLSRELGLFPEWYLQQHLGMTLSTTQQETLQQCFEMILSKVLGQACVYVHRDYHSRNLMVQTGEANPGILDFQDAVYGPISYDLFSLWRDAYIDWPEERVLDGVIRYWEKARAAGLPVPQDISEFYSDFEWVGLQRCLKVLGIFARLYHRDGKAGYLNDMPRVLNYTRQIAARYGVLTPLLRLLDVAVRSDVRNEIRNEGTQ